MSTADDAARTYGDYHYDDAYPGLLRYLGLIPDRDYYHEHYAAHPDPETGTEK
jgi:hypothetical protein